MSERKETAEPVAGDARAETSAAAVAVALGHSTRSSAVNAEAAAFLRDQRKMVNLQMEHLHEERGLHHRHLALKYFGDRLRIGLELLAVMFGLIIMIGIGALVWRAHEDHGLVVEAFSVPPDLAGRGLTGQVVASRLLDKLADMQAQTGSLRPANTYTNNWGDDLKVEIPTTGVSIGELQRLLREWLGHETRVSGEVFRTPAGLAVAARTGGDPARTFEGPDADLDKLLQSAAEAVYDATQPYRYAVFLDQHGRGAQARPILERVANAGDRADRSSAALYLSQKALFTGDYPRGVAMANVAIRAEPTWAPAYAFRGFNESSLGHSEAALSDKRKAVDLLSRVGDVFGGPEYRDYALAVARHGSAEAEDNYRKASVLAVEARAATPARLGGYEFSGTNVYLVTTQAYDLAADHDPTAARTLVAGAGLPDEPGARISRERAAEDWPALLSEMPYFLGRARDPFVASTFAYGLAKVGRLADAEAMEATTPLDCYPCVVDRGAIAAMKQDWPTAQRWFATAVSQGASLPDAHLEWGRMLLAKGNVGGAIRQFDLAHQKAPQFADPLELWGEALIRQGDYAGAAAKFADADKDAPRWGRNHMLWGQALARLGRADEAKEQYRAARGMDLSAADRATLEGLLKGA